MSKDAYLKYCLKQIAIATLDSLNTFLIISILA